MCISEKAHITNNKSVYRTMIASGYNKILFEKYFFGA